MRILLLVIVVSFMSCKSDTVNTQAKAENIEEVAQEETPIKRETNGSQMQGSLGTKSGGKAQSTMGNISADNDATSTTGAKGNITNFNKNGIPDACDLLTQETIAKYLKIPAASINIADGSSPKNKLQRACFFKWDGSEIKNAGVMVQVQKNPVADDVPEYFTYMVQSLKSDGERDMQGNVSPFYDWEDFGDDGAYSTAAGKYVWRISNDWAFMVAFNTTLSAKNQKKAARAFATEVMENMEF